MINTQYENGRGIDTSLVELVATDASHPLSFKTNKFIQSATTVTDVTDKTINSEGELDGLIEANLQLKLFENQTLKNSLEQLINLGNYGEGNFTTLNFEEHRSQMPLLPTDHPVNLDLNLLIPDADFGLLMIYYQKFTAGSNASVSWGTNNNVSLYNDICPNSTTCAKKSTLSCPYSNTSAWGAKEGTLREGINILKINASDTLTIKSNGNNKATVTFTGLELIDDAISA